MQPPQLARSARRRVVHEVREAALKERAGGGGGWGAVGGVRRAGEVGLEPGTMYGFPLQLKLN